MVIYTPENRMLRVDETEPVNYFPEAQHHRIVKKQMGILDFLEGTIFFTKSPTQNNLGVKPKRKAENDEDELQNILKSKIPQFLIRKPKRNVPINREHEKDSKKNKMQRLKEVVENLSSKKSCFWGPNNEALGDLEQGPEGANGFVEPKKKQSSADEFSLKYFQWENRHPAKEGQRKRRKFLGYHSRKFDIPDPVPDEEPEPSNEWLDASQGTGQKIPSEFKPKQKPILKVYHLRCKRKWRDFDKNLKKRNSNDLAKFSNVIRNSMEAHIGYSKNQGLRHHHPRSYLIRINKKEGKKSRVQSIREKDESEIEEEEADEEDEEDDEEGDDEDEEEDDEESEEEEKTKDEKTKKESIKDLIKSAKAAVINKVKFTENPSGSPATRGSPTVSRKTEEKQSVADDKKVLIDANIKVDSAISSALKGILSRKKASLRRSSPEDQKSEDGLSHAENQMEMSPESFKIYNTLVKSNRRV